MGKIRKVASVYTLGKVNWKSDAERAGKNIKRTAVEAKRAADEAARQTEILEGLARESAPRHSVVPRRSIAAELRELAELRDDGILTPEEFESEKRYLLGD